MDAPDQSAPAVADDIGLPPIPDHGMSDFEGASANFGPEESDVRGPREWRGVTFESDPPDILSFTYDTERNRVFVRVNIESHPESPPTESSVDTPAALTLTATRPPGYTAPVVANRGWVTWGHVNNVVPSDIADDFVLSTGLKIWATITTNGAHPVQVTAVELDSGATVPADIGGTATTPPITVHYLLGTVMGAGTLESPWVLTSSGSGNLRVETYPVGTVCQTYDPGPPIVPASIKTTYALRVVREGA